MKAMAADVRTLILSCMAARLSAAGIDGRQLADDFDFRTAGVIDSFGFLQLIVALETHLGRAVDLTELAPDHLTRLGSLADHIAKQT